MPKTRVVVIENILLFKYQKQATIAALNGEDVLMLLPTVLKKSWIYQVLPFIVTWDTSPIVNKVDHEFHTRLGIWNCRSVWSTDKFVRKLILLPKNENSSEKKSFTERFFFQESRNPVRKRKFSKMEAVTQNLAIKCYHEFYLSSHKDLEILILVAPFLLLLKVIL